MPIACGFAFERVGIPSVARHIGRICRSRRRDRVTFRARSCPIRPSRPQHPSHPSHRSLSFLTSAANSGRLSASTCHNDGVREHGSSHPVSGRASPAPAAGHCLRHCRWQPGSTSPPLRSGRARRCYAACRQKASASATARPLSASVATRLLQEVCTVVSRRDAWRPALKTDQHTNRKLRGIRTLKQKDKTAEPSPRRQTGTYR
jgi:hypothetical protein